MRYSSLDHSTNVTRLTLLLAAFTFAFSACSEELPTIPDRTALEAAKKGGNKPPPDDPPTDPTILYSKPVARKSQRKLGTYALYLMDTNGNSAQVLSDSDELNAASVGPRWAPDGNRFVYRRELGIGVFDLVVANADGSDVRAILSHAGGADWSVHEKLLYSVGGNLFVMNPDGSGSTQLTSSGDVQMELWSRDGSQILAYTWDGTGHGLRLYEVDCSSICSVTGQNDIDVSVLGLDPSDGFGPLDWAHTKDEILISICLDDRGPCDLGILDLSNSAAPSLNNITNTPGEGEYDAAWSFDDSEIVYAHWDGRGTARIEIRDLASGNVVSIVDANPTGIDWRPTPPSSP